MQEVVIYTDGGCSPNPGVGGCAALLRYKELEKKLTGAHPHTTNNQMEILSAILGLEALTKPCRVTLYSDSQYLVRGMSSWIAGWIKKNWQTQRGPVKNVALWKRLKAAADPHEVEWKWVKGHSGNADNELVDRLATKAREELQAGLREPVEFLAEEIDEEEAVEA